jgi:hypothetical protein
MLLAEDLLLLLTDDRTGRLLVTAQYVDVALAGAQLVQLSLDGRVDVDDRKRLAVLDPSPTGDPLLDGALGVVGQRAGKKPSAVIGPLGKGLRPQLYARLTASGVLRAEAGKVLGLFPCTTWPAASVEHETAVRRGVEGPLVHGLTPDPRSAALVSLLHALRSTHKVVDPKAHGLTRRELDRRAKEIAEGSWGSQAVREACDAMMAAVMAAVTASTAAATVASS